MVATTTVAGHAAALGPGEGHTIWFLSNRMTIKATAESTGGAYGLVESLVAPVFSPPLHVHHREDEAFWVLDGELPGLAIDLDYLATAMVGTGFQVATRLIDRDPPDIDSAAHFCTRLFMGGVSELARPALASARVSS
jgi:hypothetical protein